MSASKGLYKFWTIMSYMNNLSRSFLKRSFFPEEQISLLNKLFSTNADEQFGI